MNDENPLTDEKPPAEGDLLTDDNPITNQFSSIRIP